MLSKFNYLIAPPKAFIHSKFPNILAPPKGSFVKKFSKSSF